MKLIKLLTSLLLFISFNFYAQGEKMKEKREFKAADVEE